MRVSDSASEPTPIAQMGLVRRTLDLDLGDVSFSNMAARLSGTILCGDELMPHPQEAHLRTLRWNGCGGTSCALQELQQSYNSGNCRAIARPRFHPSALR